MKMQKETINCALVGDGMVGKTSLAEAMTNQEPSWNYEATVFNEFSTKVSAGGKQYTLNIFDTSGEHDGKDLRCFCYGKSDVFVVCYSTNDRDSFESVKDIWIPEVRFLSKTKTPVILVATQKDHMVNSWERTVTTSEGQMLADEIRADYFVECSSRTGLGIQTVLEKTVCSVLKRRQKIGHTLGRILGITRF